MEQADIQPPMQENQAGSALRPWVKPAFERVPLNQALSNPLSTGSDGTTYGSTYS